MDRIDLEERILRCWAITDDIEVVFRTLDRPYTEDELANMLIGLKALYNQKFQELWDTFEKCVKEGLV